MQGRGNYVDDLKLPGMLYGDFARSPYGHARITRIDTSKAKAVPGVLAVLTAADLKPLNLHYMPTLAGDVQAVLAEEKVLYQNQEVAFIIAEDRYVAADAADLVVEDASGDLRVVALDGEGAAVPGRHAAAVAEVPRCRESRTVGKAEAAAVGGEVGERGDC